MLKIIFTFFDRVTTSAAAARNNNGTFRWTSDEDYTLLKEVQFLERYQYKSGSKLAGQKWKEVADNLNCLQAFKDSPRDQGSVRECFQKIIDLFKAKIRKEEAASGIFPEPLTKTEQLAEEIVEIMDNRPNVEEDEDSKMKKERMQAMAARDSNEHMVKGKGSSRSSE